MPSESAASASGCWRQLGYCLAEFSSETYPLHPIDSTLQLGGLELVNSLVDALDSRGAGLHAYEAVRTPFEL
jgi:hypothetical protein